MHCQYTYLELAAKDSIFAANYLMKAAETHDPIERLKLVVSMYVGGHHISPEITQMRAPLNPILGETV